MQNLENFVTPGPVPPVEFTVHRYSNYEKTFKHWQDAPPFYTCPIGHKIKIVVYFASLLYVNCRSVAGKFDDQLQWPLQCTLSIQLLDQWGEHHLERRAEFKVEKGQHSDMWLVHYTYRDVRNPRSGALYLKEDCLHFRVDVKLK